MLIGHKRQTKILEKVAKSGNVPHAFLFTGPDHVGKSLVARIFFYLCAKKDTAVKDFFGEDRLATAFKETGHTDLFVAGVEEGKREIGIGQIRALKKFVGLSPFELEKKFVLVEAAEKVTREGINSILKTLEEPSGDTTMVLTTSRPSSLPATIRSRSISVPFYPVSDATVSAGLEKAGKKLAKKELGWIAGRPGLAVQFLDKENEEVRAIRENFFSFADVIKQRSLKDKITLAERVAGEDNLSAILSSWLISARVDLLNDFDEESFLRAKSIFGVSDLLGSTNANRRLQLENALLRT